MLAWLKDLVRPIRRFDPCFGPLRYLRDAGFWEGTVAFKPTGRDVEVIISGPATGPTEEQRVFLAEIESRYDSLWPSIRDRLRVEARKADAASDVDFDLVCVDLPAIPGPNAEWELSYETRPASWHFTVSFLHWEPQEVVGEC